MDGVRSARPTAGSLRNSVNPKSTLPYSLKCQFVLSIPVAQPLPYFSTSPATMSLRNALRLSHHKSNLGDTELWGRHIQVRLGNGCRRGRSSLSPNR